MAQLKEDMLLDKEKAIQIERDHYEQLLLRERQIKCDEPKDVQVPIFFFYYLLAFLSWRCQVLVCH